jgi:cytochrome c-type biogenesis protein CcmH/NrfG
MNLELLRKRATVSADEAKSGRASDWLFVGGIIAVLIALAIASFAISIYLMVKIFNRG